MHQSIKSVYNKHYNYGEGAPAFYPASGGSDDWAHIDGTDISFTIELRDTGYYGFALPESQIAATCKENIQGVKTVYDHVKPSGMPCKNVVCAAIMPNSECKYSSDSHSTSCTCKPGYVNYGGQCQDDGNGKFYLSHYFVDNIFNYIKIIIYIIYRIRTREFLRLQVVKSQPV